MQATEQQSFNNFEKSAIITGEHDLINREVSWLSFNERVLQEAADSRTPLIERIKFLGIFSSNLDEFFRVRVAVLKRMQKAGKQAKQFIGEAPMVILERIQDIVIRLQDQFDTIYESILKELEKHKVYIINEQQLSWEQRDYVKKYFHMNVRPALFPIMLHSATKLPYLRDNMIYLAVLLKKTAESKTSRYALIEVPTDKISRFLVLPNEGSNEYIMLLDDVVRVGLEDIFYIFNYKHFEAYTIKLTRDAELDLDDDITKSFFEKISKSLKQRKRGLPTRFIYDEEMPESMLNMLVKKMKLGSTDSVIPGGRYHNFKDFMGFPAVGGPDLKYDSLPPLAHKDIGAKTPIINIIKKKDILLHYPYQSFHYVIDLLREASIDPKVESIKICIYRLAEESNIANALVNATRNGKKVTVVMELQARFDEEANIEWTNTLREEGAHIIHGVPNLKVHCKLCLISRREGKKKRDYAYVSTGNFHEQTAKLYCDHGLMTADKRITKDAKRVFDFFDNNYDISEYESFLVSPFFLRKQFYKLIDTEIKNAQKGKESYIIVKVNNLVDRELSEKLYEASNAGVKITLIVRSTCSVVPGMKGMSENISIISIVDRFLEHSRIFIFCNGGKEKYYIGSADWMTRNLDRRVEVTCPIYSEELKKELREYVDIQLKDNTKARIINKKQNNKYKTIKPKEPPVRAQTDFYIFMKEKLRVFAEQ